LTVAVGFHFPAAASVPGKARLAFPQSVGLVGGRAVAAFRFAADFAGAFSADKSAFVSCVTRRIRTAAIGRMSFVFDKAGRRRAAAMFPVRSDGSGAQTDARVVFAKLFGGAVRIGAASR